VGDLGEGDKDKGVQSAAHYGGGGGGGVAICQCLVSEPAVDSIRLFGCHPAVLATLNCSIRFALTFVRIFTRASLPGRLFPT
jgi:hypothetical protein